MFRKSKFIFIEFIFRIQKEKKNEKFRAVKYIEKSHLNNFYKL